MKTLHLFHHRAGKVLPLMAMAALVCLVFVAGSALAGGGGFSMPSFVVGGGGGHSEAGGYALHATVGQPVVGTFALGSDELCAGFWCGVAPYRVYLPVVRRDS